MIILKLRSKLRVFLSYKLSPRVYMKLAYMYIYKRKLNLKSPKYFSEKIWWLKRYNKEYKSELIKRCYDKYNVREYVKEKVGNGILNELIGVYDSAYDIDFDCLPNKFVLKITQSYGKNIICVDKNKLDIEETKMRLEKWLTEVRDLRYYGDESYYLDGNPKIICEKFLENSKGNIPEDYRIYCFNGIPKLIVCDIETTKADGTHGDNIIRNVYDTQWNFLDVFLGRKNNYSKMEAKPDNLLEILEIASQLSKDFPFVRVDLYNLDGRIVFGELTWIPMGGNCVIKPKSFDKQMGDMLELPNINLSWED